MIIIIGASKGIGHFLFEEFQKEGLEVVGTYNSTTVNIGYNFYKVDISDEASIDAFISNLSLQGKKIALINCAGISYNSFAHKADMDKWKKVIDVNLIGIFNVIRFFLPYMRKMNYGRIINLSSVVTKYPTPGTSAYTASKAAINALTKCLALENSSKGITINSINLGYTNAGMGINDVPEEYRLLMMDRIPMHRFCNPIEVLSTIRYIINTEYVTGSIIDINGGLI